MQVPLIKKIPINVYRYLLRKFAISEDAFFDGHSTRKYRKQRYPP